MSISFRVGVHLFLRDGNKILLLKCINSRYEEPSYNVITGKIEGREDAQAAVIREAKSQVGITVLYNDLKVVQVMQRRTKTDDHLDYFLECVKWNGTPQNMESYRCAEIRWIDIDELPEKTDDYIRYAVENYKTNNAFTTFRL
jgi:ADP-ribose pyrophosphatase YjhB (NUDIX family)